MGNQNSQVDENRQRTPDSQASDLAGRLKSGNVDLSCREFSAEYGVDMQPQLLAELLKLSPDRNRWCSEAVLLFASNRHWRLVQQLLHAIEDSKVREICAAEAAKCAAMWQDWREAENLVLQVMNERLRQTVCSDLAKFAASACNGDVADMFTCIIADQNMQDDCLHKSATAAAAACDATITSGEGRAELAARLVAKIQNPESRDRCSREVAGFLSVSGHWEMVERLFVGIEEQKIKEDCSSELAPRAAESGRWQIAASLAASIVEQSTRDSVCLKVLETAVVKDQFQPLANELVPTMSKAAVDQSCSDCAVLAAAWERWDNAGAAVRFIKDQKVQDECRICIAKQAGQKEAWSVAVEFLGGLADISRRNSCFKELAKAAGSKHEFKAFVQLVNEITDVSIQDDCRYDVTCTRVKNKDIDAANTIAQSIADKTVKDRCLSEAARLCTAVDQWNSITPLVSTITDQRLKDDCCACIATTDNELKHAEEVLKLVQIIDNSKRKDSCCIELSRTAASLEDWETHKSLLNLVSDASVQDRCCEEAAICAASMANWGQAVRLCGEIQRSSELRNSCLRELAKLALGRRRYDVAEEVAGKISDCATKNYCYSDTATMSATWEDWEDADNLAKQITDGCLRDQCYSNIALTCCAAKKWIEANRFGQKIRDQDVKDRCFKELAVGAANAQLWAEADKFVLELCKYEVQLTCITEVAKLASTAQEWAVALSVLQLISEQDNRERGFYDVSVSAVHAENTEAAVNALSMIRNIEFRDLCTVELVKLSAVTGLANVAEMVKLTSSRDIAELCRSDAIKAAALSGSFNLLMQQLPPKASVLSVFDFDSRAGKLQPSEWQLRGLSNCAIAAESEQTITRLLDDMKQLHRIQLFEECISFGYSALAVLIVPHLNQVDQRDEKGSTALMLATDEDRHEIVKSLLESGASVQAADNLGRTALARAFLSGNEKIAKTLIDSGSNVHHRDRQGLTCAQMAEMAGQREVLRLLDYRNLESSSLTEAFVETATEDESSTPEELSLDLHQRLNQAGFTKSAAIKQQALASNLEAAAQEQSLEHRLLIGSCIEGWGYGNLALKTPTDAAAKRDRLGTNDINWTVLVGGKKKIFHLADDCQCEFADDEEQQLEAVKNGRIHLQSRIGQVPIVTKGCSTRPQQTTCHAFRCCSCYRADRVRLLLPAASAEPVHLIRTIATSSTRELQISFSNQERKIMQSLCTVQGQLFVLIKFIFVELLPNRFSTTGLSSYHAKTLLFHMMEKHRLNIECWQPTHLIQLLQESLSLMLQFFDSNASSDICMPHFFIPDVMLQFRNAGLGGDFQRTKEKVRQLLQEFVGEIEAVVSMIVECVRPAEFRCNLFTLLPLMRPSEMIIPTGNLPNFEHPVKIFNFVFQCLKLLESKEDFGSEEKLMRCVSTLPESCVCVSTCLNVMLSLRANKFKEAERVLIRWTRWLEENRIENFENQHYQFCLPFDEEPKFHYLPTFTQSLFSFQRTNKVSTHLYVNFRCLCWSLQAEIVSNHRLDSWFAAMQTDFDYLELLALAHYSNYKQHTDFCIGKSAIFEDGARVAIEVADENRIEYPNDWSEEYLLLRCQRLAGHNEPLAHQRQFEPFDETLLTIAVKRNSVACLEALLSGAAATSIVSDQPVDVFGRTALWWACKRGRLEIFAQLLQATASSPSSIINRVDNSGLTPLMLAVVEGHDRVVDLMAKQPSIDLNKMDLVRSTALTHACRCGRVNIVDLLLQNGASAAPGIGSDNAETSSFGSLSGIATPLIWAARRGHKSVIVKLTPFLKHLEDWQAVDEYERTALQSAEFFGHQECADYIRTCIRKFAADASISEPPSQPPEGSGDENGSGATGNNSEQNAGGESGSGSGSGEGNQGDPPSPIEPPRYEIRTDNHRRLAIVINNVRFGYGSDASTRGGAQLDDTKVVDMLLKLGFHSPQTMKNARRLSMLSIGFEDRELQECDVFLLLVMSHGYLGHIESSDGFYLNLEIDLFRRFRQLEGLKNKPKLFLVQSCRQVSATQQPEVAVEIVSPEDCLYFYSTAEGGLSERHSQLGSPFVQSVLKVCLADRSRRAGLLDLTARVIDEVQKLTNGRQIPCLISTLNKEVYLRRN
ncbi:hypothetical protein BOX15_Mlig026614g1 [Macrostomum lignano]|uniref:ANK_REP_REGION domain-containing protein n=1 Tax=Macrostomum lignano TaxID=282301 RepID=A0A267H6X4_9PLAT|nr:hypothetical protein BOX15_Mlig026614g1 [Macrostomum lignano]